MAPPVSAPYLIHSGYELPLLLDGRKKLARMSDGYPPMTFDGEHRFDHWVAEGALHREEVVEPFDSPVRGYLGIRAVYYTPKGTLGAHTRNETSAHRSYRSDTTACTSRLAQQP
jgi:hypothetical protein